MAIIVENKKTSEKYILLGSGYGLYQSKKPNWFLGDLLADTEQGSTQALCVCDKNGQVFWLSSENAHIISVDGKSPQEYFI